MGQYSLNNDEGFGPLRKHGEPQLYGLTHMHALYYTFRDIYSKNLAKRSLRSKWSLALSRHFRQDYAVYRLQNQCLSPYYRTVITANSKFMAKTLSQWVTRSHKAHLHEFYHSFTCTKQPPVLSNLFCLVSYMSA